MLDKLLHRYLGRHVWDESGPWTLVARGGELAIVRESRCTLCPLVQEQVLTR